MSPNASVSVLVVVVAILKAAELRFDVANDDAGEKANIVCD
jgi:hypothetical protein